MPGDLWTSATRHPFLMAVRNQTITPRAFDRWLVQDALYVADLLTFQARLLARAPRSAQGVLARGCLGLVDELDWFEERAARRGLSLDQPRQPATDAYAALLTRLDGMPRSASTGRRQASAGTSPHSPRSPLQSRTPSWSRRC